MLFYHELGGSHCSPPLGGGDPSVPPLTPPILNVVVCTMYVYMYLYMQELRQRMLQTSGGGAGLRPPVMKAQTLGSSPTRQPDKVITTCTCTCISHIIAPEFSYDLNPHFLNCVIFDTHGKCVEHTQSYRQVTDYGDLLKNRKYST